MTPHRVWLGSVFVSAQSQDKKRTSGRRIYLNNNHLPSTNSNSKGDDFLEDILNLEAGLDAADPNRAMDSANSNPISADASSSLIEQLLSFGSSSHQHASLQPIATSVSSKNALHLSLTSHDNLISYNHNGSFPGTNDSASGLTTGSLSALPSPMTSPMASPPHYHQMKSQRSRSATDSVLVDLDVAKVTAADFGIALSDADLRALAFFLSNTIKFYGYIVGPLQSNSFI